MGEYSVEIDFTPIWICEWRYDQKKKCYSFLGVSVAWMTQSILLYRFQFSSHAVWKVALFFSEVISILGLPANDSSKYFMYQFDTWSLAFIPQSVASSYCSLSLIIALLTSIYVRVYTYDLINSFTLLDLRFEICMLIIFVLLVMWCEYHVPCILYYVAIIVPSIYVL